jgi:hypothetical protein
MHLEAVIEQVWRCIWRARSFNSEIHLEDMMESEFVDALGGQDQVELSDALGGRDQASLGKHWKAVIELLRDALGGRD